MRQLSKLAGHAFICYGREDSRRVDQLQRELEAAGIPVWRDTASIWPGQDWRANIRHAISKDAVVFIACFSSSSVARAVSYQNEELAEAIDQLRQRHPGDPWLIPVRLDECEIPDRDIGGGRTLASIQRADLFGARAREDTARLIAAITAKLESTTEKPARTGRSSRRVDFRVDWPRLRAALRIGWLRPRTAFLAWPWPRRRAVAPATAIVMAVSAAALATVLAADAGAVRLPGIVLSSRPAGNPVEITGVQFSGSRDNYAVIVTGHGFGTASKSLPFYGEPQNFRIADDGQLSSAAAIDGYQSPTLDFETWNDREIVIYGVAAKPGDAIVIAVWNNKTGAGASWGGNITPVPSSAPVIRTVAFARTATGPAITIRGTGFGPPPARMPFTGNLDYLVISDWRSGRSRDGVPNSWSTADSVNARIESWTSNEIQVGGFSGAFGRGPYVLRPQDPITIQIWADGKYPAGPQAAWGGRFADAGRQPAVQRYRYAGPPSAIHSVYVVSSDPDSITAISADGRERLSIPVRDPGSIAITPDGKTAYVGTGTEELHVKPTVTPINIAANRAGPAIALPANSYSTIIDITPDGRTAYAASTYAGTVTPINTATNKAGPAIKVTGHIGAAAITPDGKTIYVTSGHKGAGMVTPISTTTNKAGRAIRVGKEPSAIAITPSGSAVYVVNSGSNTVSPISTATNTAGPAIPVGTDPEAVAITPDGSTAYVANANDPGGKARTRGTVTPINLATGRTEQAIKVGSLPEEIMITPDGETAWVLNFFSQSVTPISTASNTAGQPITIDYGAYDMAITPDGKLLYIASGSWPPGAVTPIDTSTGKSRPPAWTAGLPTAIAINPHR